MYCLDAAFNTSLCPFEILLEFPAFIYLSPCLYGLTKRALWRYFDYLQQISLIDHILFR